MSNPYDFTFAEPSVTQRLQRARGRRKSGLSWQLWIVVILLGLEGIKNLLSIPVMPEAAGWLATKVLLIVGLVLKWRPVFVLAIGLGLLHVAAFLHPAPFFACLNLVLTILVASQFRTFFPGHTQVHADVGSQPDSSPPHTGA